MSYWVVAAGAITAVIAVLVVTGWWRYAMIAAHVSPSRMTVERLGLAVTGAEDVARVNSILKSFVTGFNLSISRPDAKAWLGHARSLPMLEQPFTHEGAAMGYTLRRLFRFDPRRFEATMVRPRPEFRYLYYVGLGFWSGMRGHDVSKILRVAQDLDPLHRYLCFDGYGFTYAFFRYPKDIGALKALDGLPGYARNAAYQGVGRAFYFLYLSSPALMIEHISRLGVHAGDAAAGVGLAAVFVHPDRLDRAQDLGLELPVELRPHFHLGMCFGLKARSIIGWSRLEGEIRPLSTEVRDSVYASIRECDRVELLVRAEKGENPYYDWRSRVTEWMTRNIEFPMFGVRSVKVREPSEFPALKTAERTA